MIELKQGMLLKSSDGEYVYNLYSYSPLHATMTLDILDRDFNTVTTKYEYSVQSFKDQIEAGTIVPFEDSV